MALTGSRFAHDNLMKRHWMSWMMFSARMH